METKHTPECNCTESIQCALCKSAPDLYEAVLCALGGEYVTQDGQRIPMIAGNTRKALEQAIAKAEGK